MDKTQVYELNIDPTTWFKETFTIEHPIGMDIPVIAYVNYTQGKVPKMPQHLGESWLIPKGDEYVHIACSSEFSGDGHWLCYTEHTRGENANKNAGSNTDCRRQEEDV